MAKQITEPVVAHHPRSVAEIRQTQAALSERDIALMNEGAAVYKAIGNGLPSRPMSDHDRQVAAHIKLMMNGSTPPHLLVPAVSRDEQIRAERDAIAYVQRDLSSPDSAKPSNGFARTPHNGARFAAKSSLPPRSWRASNSAHASFWSRSVGPMSAA